MAELTIGGSRVHYRETGTGPPVILLHSGGSSGAQWRRVCDQLAAHCRGVTLDFHGHGGTGPWPREPEGRTHDADAEVVSAVIDHIGGRPAHVVGHSYGGGVAVRLAVIKPGAARSMVLIEPQCWSMLRHGGERAHYDETCDTAYRFLADVRAGRAEEAWHYFIDTNNGAGSWDRMPPDARARIVALTDAGVSLYHANLNHPTTPDDCREIGVPTLVLVGARTAPRYRRMAELVAEHIPGARLEVLPEAGHMSPLTHPDAVAAAIERHLTMHG